ncbi:MAG: hypothetical protein EPO28_17150 [Saprospiraceae bacterium]|nr:MAG: hypothetical protein EPO28_17150 [Saprospiraceae bacterium]
MKTRLQQTIVPLLLALLPGFIFAQHGEKTFVKAFNLEGNLTVFIDLDGEVEVKTWPEEQMRLLMNVHLENGSDVMLKSLMQAGRYSLQSEELTKGFTVFAPQLEKEVRMRNGQSLVEMISYTLYVPTNVQVLTRKNIGELSLSTQ